MGARAQEGGKSEIFKIILLSLFWLGYWGLSGGGRGAVEITNNEVS